MKTLDDDQTVDLQIKNTKRWVARVFRSKAKLKGITYPEMLEWMASKLWGKGAN